MAITRFSKAQKFLKDLQQEKGNLISFDDFRIEVIKKIGADEYKTVKPYLKMMTELKMISAEDQNVRIN